jgi:hypothetical protein
MKKGRCATMTHEYKRNGTTTLFAALDILKDVEVGYGGGSYVAPVLVREIEQQRHHFTAEQNSCLRQHQPTAILLRSSDRLSQHF